MNCQLTSDLVLQLHFRLSRAGLNPEELFERSSEIAVFGSRATETNSDDSDLDVLCFTDRRERAASKTLDFICYPGLVRKSSIWRQTELATHVARYGIWLKGEGEWRKRALVEQRTIRSKQNRVESLIRNAYVHWPGFHPLFREKYARTIRRELQRLEVLEWQLPVPSTPMLDAKWETDCRPSQLVAVASRVRGMYPKYLSWISQLFQGR